MKTQIASIAFALVTALTASNASALSYSVAPTDVELTSNYQDASCDLWGKVSSKRSNSYKPFVFYNDTSTYRIISWLDYNGDVKERATLRPGQYVEIDSYKGHPWMVQDGRGN